MTYALLLVCFFLSGFAALLYETAWTREFAFVFGTSELAVVAVLAAYMGGLALGAALAARWAPRIRRPVLTYGLLELVIALWALALPFAIRAVRHVYLGWLGGLDALPETLGIATHAFHLAGAFAVLVPCTALMGATLPLLASFAVRRDEQIGPRVGLLYAVNTAGAIAGTLAAAFVLLPALGLRQTVYVGAAVNALVFAAAAALARSAAPGAGARAPRATGAPSVPWILPAIALSGAISFGYEVLWFRLLGQLLGASTAAFSTMLASFLAGIALGSAVASRWSRTRAAAARGFAAAQLLTAVAAWLAFLAADRLPEPAAALGVSVNALAPGALLAAAVLMPLTLCIGSTFPFAVRLLARDADDASASSARVYAWNTVGSIAGSVGTGYALLPWLGLERTLVAGALGNLALALWASLAVRPPRRALAGAALAAALFLALFPTPRPDRLLRTSPLGGRLAGPFTHFAVGRSSTVALIEQEMGWRLTTNGLPESYIWPADYPLGHADARWLSILPVLLRPETRHMVIIGLGAGMTVAAVPRTVAAIDVIELEPEVVAANLAVRSRAGGDPLADPRVTLRLGDARGALILADRRYDAIVSQPSHPWTSGASHLYTREFFELVRSRLTPEGVFVQWMGPAFVDAERLRSLLAALTGEFRYVQVYRPVSAIVMAASSAPFDVASSAAQAIDASPGDFAGEGIHRVEDVFAALSLDSDASRALADRARPNSDDFNLFATSDQPSPQAGPWLERALAPGDPLPALADRLDLAVLARRLHAQGLGERARRLADRLDPARRSLVLGWLEIDARRLRLARRHLRAALDADAGATDAAIGLALVDSAADIAGLPDRAQAVIEAHRRADRWEAARAVDDRLAQWRPGELLYTDAAELRVRWRLELGERAEIDEAMEILTPLAERSALPRYLLYRAQIAARQRNTRRAWASLLALARSANASPVVAAQGLALAGDLGEPPFGGLLEMLERRARGERPAAAEDAAPPSS